MEATLLINILTAGLCAFALLYVLLLRPWRPRRFAERFAPGIDALFLLGLATGTAALYSAPPFERGAAVLVELTDLPATLLDLDGQITRLETMPERIWADLSWRMGWGSEPPAPPDGPPAPGLVTENVRPAVDAVVEVLLRAFTYWGSLIVLAVSLVMRGIAGRPPKKARQAPERRHADLALEARVASLEESLAALHTR
jgi:hypothetical protein